MVLQAKAGDWQAGVEFFRDEYTLDYLIGELAGPRGGAGGDQVHPPGGGERRRIAQVSLLDGYVMGGGVGVCMPGAFRVATERCASLGSLGVDCMGSGCLWYASV